MRKSLPGITKLLVVVVIAVSAFAVSGFTIFNININEQSNQKQLPNAGTEPRQLTNVIKNGDFEYFRNTNIAEYWNSFDNGVGHFGWYREKWREAVQSGKHSQLMEIAYTNTPGRAIAIYQTVDVVPNATYSLTLHVIMRTDAPHPLRNKGDYEMNWGVDYRGRGAYFNVLDWTRLPVNEQLRIGSAGIDPMDRKHLSYKRVTGTIFTADSDKITLFIRGVKVGINSTEVLFNVDDVSLIGPYFPPPITTTNTTTATDVATATTTLPGDVPPVIFKNLLLNRSSALPAVSTNNAYNISAIPASIKYAMPNAGAVLPADISPGILIMSLLVIAVLMGGAVTNVKKKKSTKANKKLDKNRILS